MVDIEQALVVKSNNERVVKFYQNTASHLENLVVGLSLIVADEEIVEELVVARLELLGFRMRENFADANVRQMKKILEHDIAYLNESLVKISTTIRMIQTDIQRVLVSK